MSTRKPWEQVITPREGLGVLPFPQDAGWSRETLREDYPRQAVKRMLRERNRMADQISRAIARLRKERPSLSWLDAHEEVNAAGQVLTDTALAKARNPAQGFTASALVAMVRARRLIRGEPP
jgi:hypothetical protein